MLGVSNNTEIIVPSQRRCYAYDPNSHVHIFYNAGIETIPFGFSLAKCRFLMYKNQLIRVGIRLKHGVTEHFEIRGNWTGTDFSSWPLRASDLTMHGNIKLKSIIHPLWLKHLFTESCYGKVWRGTIKHLSIILQWNKWVETSRMTHIPTADEIPAWFVVCYIESE